MVGERSETNGDWSRGDPVTGILVTAPKCSESLAGFEESVTITLLQTCHVAYTSDILIGYVIHTYIKHACVLCTKYTNGLITTISVHTLYC